MNSPDLSIRPSLLSLTTLVMWGLCCGVGLLGFNYPYSRPMPPAPEKPAVQARILDVELTPDPILPLDALKPPQEELSPPALLELPKPPVVPSFTPVAVPSPSIAFELPVQGPVQIVPVAQAAYVEATTQPAPAAPGPAVQQLTFGQGEGKQPAPEYPARARREGQEGTVKIVFTVDESGKVVVAQVLQASPWALLNNSALRVVRERWRFRAGPRRDYEVSIRFEIQR